MKLKDIFKTDDNRGEIASHLLTGRTRIQIQRRLIQKPRIFI